MPTGTSPAPSTLQFGNVALSSTAITSSGFNVLPSTLCLFFTLRDGAAASETSDSTLHPGRQKLSVCLRSLENQGVSFTALPFNGATALGQTAQSQSLVQSWSRFYAGPSYSLSVSEHVALGLSIHGVYSTDSFILDSNAITTSTANGGVQSSFGAAGGGGSFDFSATIGGIYRNGPYTLGLSVAVPSVHVFGSYTGTLHDEYGSGTTGSATISNGSGSFSAAPPVRVGVGLGGEWAHLMMEADASLNIPAPTNFSAGLAGTTSVLATNKLTSTPFQSTFSVPEHVTLSAGLGAEYFVKPTLSLVGGTSVNLTAQPPLSPTVTVGNLVQERQSMATLSLGAGSYSPSGNLLLGTQLGYGWGQSLAANPYAIPNQWAVVDTSSYSVMIILAGSTSLRNLGHALERIEHVIVRPSDPDYVEPVVPLPPPSTPPPSAPGAASPKPHPAPTPVSP